MLATGFAETFEPVEIDNPVDGDHVQVEAPVANKETEVPKQVLLFPLTETVGDKFTVNATVFNAEQPPDVPEMVQVMLVKGAAETVAPVVTFNPVDGDHE